MIVSTVRWLETVVMGVVVYQQTGSAFIVAMITMLRLLPMGLFGAFLGAFAERFDRRLTLAGMVVLLALTSALLSIIAWFGTLEVWHFAVGELHQRLRLGDRQSAAPHHHGRGHGPRSHGHGDGARCRRRQFQPHGRPDGRRPDAGRHRHRGRVRAERGDVRHGNRGHADGAHPHAATPGAGAVLARTWESITIVAKDPRLSAIMLVTIIYNVFAWPFTSMIPVIGRDQLLLGPEGVGLLTSVDGVGAFVGALLLALWLTPGWHARAYVGGVAVYLLSLIAFALAPEPVSAGAALLVTGLSGAAFSTLQATTVYLAAPVEMRSRIMGVLSVCIGTGPIGFVWLGWLADRIGAPYATALTGVMGLLALAATWPLWRRI